jgi:hypothetical protein
MKITRNDPPKAFMPFTIQIDSLQELICMRAIIDAAYRGSSITTVMRDHWCRGENAPAPQPVDAQNFARRLRDALPEDQE